MMRRIITLVVCVVLTIPFVGCASNTSEEQMGKDSPVKSDTILKGGLSIPSKVEQGDINDYSNSLIPGDGVGTIVYPNDFDRAIAKEKGLAEGEFGADPPETENPDGTVTTHLVAPEIPALNQKFFYVQALYRKALEEYLAEKIDFKKMDDTIAQDPAKYIPRIPGPAQMSPSSLYPWDQDYIDYYQEHSRLDLSYIFLRNNIHVEKLSEDDLKVFEEPYKNGDTAITDEMRKIVERTYPDVISAAAPTSDSAWNKAGIAWYQKMPGCEAPYNAIVFGIGVHWSTWDSEMAAHLNDELIPQFEKECEGALGDIPIVFFSNML